LWTGDIEGAKFLNREASGIIRGDVIWFSGEFFGTAHSFPQVHVLGDLIIAPNASLTIYEGTTVKFAPGAKLIVQGRLNTWNYLQENFRVVFTARDSTAQPGYWEGIRFENAASSTLRRCDVRYASVGFHVGQNAVAPVVLDKCIADNCRYEGIVVSGKRKPNVWIWNSVVVNNGRHGILCDNTASPIISYCRIERNKGDGIRAENFSTPQIIFNYIAENNGYGITALFGSGALVHHNTIVQNGEGGILALASSNLDGYTTGRNVVFQNNGYGVHADGSSVTLGTAATGFHYIAENQQYQVYADADGVAEARNVYWGTSTGFSAGVVVEPMLQGIPYPVGWGKASDFNPAEVHEVSDSLNLAVPIPQGTRQFEDMVAAALMNGEWNDVLRWLSEWTRGLAAGEPIIFDAVAVQRLFDNTRIPTVVRKQAALALVQKTLADGNTSQVLVQVLNYTSLLPEARAELRALIGVLLLETLNNPIGARSAVADLQLLSIVGTTPQHRYASRLARFLDEMINDYLRLYPSMVTAVEDGEGRKADIPLLPGGTLSINYPNPFNPRTSIQFRVSGAAERHGAEGAHSGFVQLKVYDMLGREVTTLVNEWKEPGVYTVMFEPHIVSSGVYFYRLQVGTTIETRKMLLIR
jgi:hypothetical protein